MPFLLILALLAIAAVVGGLLFAPIWTREQMAREFLGHMTVGGLAGSFILFLGVLAFTFTDTAANLWRVLTEDILTNWQLFLLGTTSIVLSLASGYTTWDGMTNFTGDSILSLMITFGIQGVMLIAAWLIGESFAVGMGGGHGTGKSKKLGSGIIVTVLVGAALALVVVALAPILFDAAFGTRANDYAKSIVTSFQKHRSGAVTIGIVAAGLLALGVAVSQREIFSPYLRGLKVILRNLPIWLMFLACMGTSVFFSFDSLFSTIFPKEERKRAGDLRTLNQVSGLVADIGSTIARRRVEEIEALFTSDDWKAYEKRLDDLVRIARKAPDSIRATILQDLQDKQAETAVLQEKKASAEGQRVQLEKRKDALLADVNSLKGEVSPVAVEVDKFRQQMFDKDREIVAAKAQAESEARGIGNTGKVGKGPRFKELADALRRLQEEHNVLDLQFKDLNGKLVQTRSDLSSKEAELAQIDGELGKLRGLSEVADKQMRVQSDLSNSNAAPTADASGGLDSLELSLAQFRQQPEAVSFQAVQKHCSDLLKTFERVKELKTEAEQKAIRCEPGLAADQAGKVFALSAGIERYKAGCGKGENLPQETGADGLLGFASKCVQDSGLSGADTADFRGRLNRVALGRDDKAHRFVVTWNAFQDGNQLAYLALSIAFALDGLVFMSGLFGANAVRSSLSDLPHGRRRSATQLEAIIDTALLPDRFGNARMVIETMKPISRDEKGHVGEIFIDDFHSEFAKAQARKVLTAGATINAVSRDPVTADRYLVRAEFYEYLAEVCERELRQNPGVRQAAEVERDQAADDLKVFRQASKAEGEAREKSNVQKSVDERRKQESKETLASALLPKIRDNAGLVLETMQPITNENGFSSEIIFEYDEIGSVRTRQHEGPLHSDELKMLRRVLNAGSALGVVRRARKHAATVRDDLLDQGGPARADGYEIKPELTLWLTEIHRDGGARPAQLQLEGPARDGGPDFQGSIQDGANIVGMQRRVEDRGRNFKRLTSRIAERAQDAPPPGFQSYAADAEMDPSANRPSVNQQATRLGSKYAAYGRNPPQKPDLAQAREAFRPLNADEPDGDPTASVQFAGQERAGPEQATVHFDHRRDQALVDGFFVQLFDRMKLQQSDIIALEQIDADRRYDFDAMMQKSRNVDKRLHKAIDDNEELWTNALSNANQTLADENPMEMYGHIDRAAVRIRGWISAAVCKNTFDNLRSEFDRIEREYDTGGTLAQSRQDDVLIDEVKLELQRGATAAARDLDGLPDLGRAVYRLTDLLDGASSSPAKANNIYQLNTRRSGPE